MQSTTPQRLMPRPRTDLPPAAAILALADAEGRLTLRVTPGARVETVIVAGPAVLVKVRAKPEDGKANAAVLDLLARALGLAPSRLRLLRGATGRDKQVQILPG